MTQAGAARSLSTSSLVAPVGAHLRTDDRQFVFDLDVFQHCVRAFGSKDAAGDAQSGSDEDETQLRDAEVPEDPFVGGGVEMLDLSCFDAVDLFKRHSPAVRAEFNDNALEVVTPQRHQLYSETRSDQPPKLSKSEFVSPLPKKKKQNQNQSRKRQREELTHLRASVQELQSQLNALLNGDPSSESTTSANTSGETCTSSQRDTRQLFVLQVLVWKRAVTTEKQQVEHAAAENMKLRALIDEATLVCKNLREACFKRSAPQMPYGDFQYDRAAVKKPTAFNTVSDSAIFASLREGLDVQFQRVGAVWDECGFSNSLLERREERNLRSDKDGKFYLERTKSRISPFTPHAMSGAVWKLMKSGLFTPTNGELKMCRVLGNTLYATLEDTISLPNSQDASIKVWASMKRFIEDHRVVTVFQILVEIEYSDRVVQITENGWNVVQSVVTVDEKSKRKRNQCGLRMAPSVSQLCIRSTPGLNCEAGENELVDGSLTAMVLNQFHDNMGMLDQTIENFLLDESLARSSRGGADNSTGIGCRGGDSSGSVRFSDSPSGAAV